MTLEAPRPDVERGRARALALSWFAYASYYLGRKNFSVVKSAVARELGLSVDALAWIDTAYLSAYALGQLPSGIAIDRFHSRQIVSLGLTISALACALFGSANSAAVLAGCFVVNGLAQSTGWPGTTKIVMGWTNETTRGRVMGLWSTCYQAGGIVATALATWLLAHYGWRAAFRVPALWLLITALAIALLLPTHRVQREVTQPTEHHWRVVLRMPVLYGYGACYFCIKLIRYSLLFWLPYYLHTSAGFDESASGYMSTALEVGGVIGSVAVGYASDRFARANVAAIALLGLALTLLAYAAIPSNSSLWHVIALALIGMLLFGPDALVSGAATQDVAGSAAAATAVGFVNGLGSLGALLQGALTVGVQRAFGWNGVFYTFVALSLCAAACLLPSIASHFKYGSVAKGR